MRAIGYWLMGLGLLQSGHVLDRLLVGLVPKNRQFQDPPFWTIGLLVASIGVHWVVGKGVRRGLPAARAAAIVLVSAWMVASLVSLNTESEDARGFGHASGAFAGAWRAAGWPWMLGHLGDFSWVPSRNWAFAELFAAALTLGIGLWTIGVLATPASGAPAPASPPPPSLPGAPPPPEGAVRARLAALRDTERRTVWTRIHGALLAGHLAAVLVQTVVALAGITDYLMHRV